MAEILRGVLMPFIGTTLGSAWVFFIKKSKGILLQRILTAFAAGVMTAAAFWSLLMPSIEMAENMGSLSFVPAALGFMAGIGFLLLLDSVIPHIHINSKESEGPKSKLKNTTKMVLALVLHNIPEGMAVGIVYAGYVSGSVEIASANALALSIGIALQNLPEGAIISMPLHWEGASKKRAFLYGTLSGVVEPLFSILTIFISGIIMPFLPYFLSFAAGAMVYVVVEELIPQMSEGGHSNIGTIVFSLGFLAMMILDVVLG